MIHKTKRTKKHENTTQGKNGIGITPRLKGIWNPATGNLGFIWPRDREGIRDHQKFKNSGNAWI